MTGSKTAILFFSFTASAECARKPMPGLHVRTDLRLKSALIDDSLTQIKHTGLPYFWINENLQRGKTFGEKLANAVSSVFAQGYDRVIIAGNDCPSLSTSRLLTTAARLQDYGLVIGPTACGAYVIGINKHYFDEVQFADISWCNSSSRSSLFDYCEQQQANYFLLPENSDINSREDIFKADCRKATTLFLMLQSLCAYYIPTIRYRISLLSYDHRCALSRGGPPAASPR